ncbi:MAG: hypothetical protein KFB94_08370 [Methylophilaceae bacterium]|nr:MAG: hypothetical protein KFB94_08370 [Methylophilaceae bacterium]
MKQAKFIRGPSELIPKQRHWLFGLLLLTVLATIWTAVKNESTSSEEVLITQQNATVVRQTSSRIRLNQTVASTIQLNHAATASNSTVDRNLTTQIGSRSHLPITHNLFSAQTWQPLLTKADYKARLAPSPPLAPPVPYTYVGKVEEEGEIEYFVLQQNKLINLKMGQLLQGQWRLDSEDTQYLNWTFVPMDLPQTLPKQNNRSRDVFATFQE